VQWNIHGETGGNMLIRILLNLFIRLSYEIDKITQNLKVRSHLVIHTNIPLTPHIGGLHSIYTMHRYALVATTTHDTIIMNNRHISYGEHIAVQFPILDFHVASSRRVTNFGMKNYICLTYLHIYIKINVICINNKRICFNNIYQEIKM